jgi:hypothetical protein
MILEALTALQLDQFQVNCKPVSRELQRARLAINAAAHHVTGLHLDSTMSIELQENCKVPHTMQLTCNSMVELQASCILCGRHEDRFGHRHGRRTNTCNIHYTALVCYCRIVSDFANCLPLLGDQPSSSSLNLLLSVTSSSKVLSSSVGSCFRLG